MRFSGIFSKRLRVFSPSFTYLIYVFIYAEILIITKLTLILTKLCHIKRDHPVYTIYKMSTIGLNARWHFLAFPPKSWEFLVQILHTYYTFLSTPDYKILSNYLQQYGVTSPKLHIIE